jgi:tetratricopeptide (TPR) repeat protein
MAAIRVSTLARLVAITTISLVAPIAALAQDLPESSPQALLHHAQGVDSYLKGANAEAIRHFLLAFESDPTSFVSLLMAGVAAGNAGQGARADSLYALVVPHKDKLSAYYRYRLEAQMASRVGDVAGTAAANRKAAELGAGTKAWYNIGQAINPRGQFGEAREALRKLSPDKEPMKGWYSYYSVYASAAHQLGDYEDELQMARRARAAFPGDIRPYELEAGALAALGRATDVDRVLGEVQAMKAQGGVSPGDILTNVAQELMAHGNAAAGRRWLENSLKWHDALPADTARTINNRASRAYTLYLMGRAKDAAGIYASLASDAPATAVWKAWVGYTAALTSDRAKALEVSQQIESGAINLGRVNGPLWRALIASGLNERDRALALFRESGTRALWMHRDPIVSRAMGATWMTFLKENAE